MEPKAPLTPEFPTGLSSDEAAFVRMRVASLPMARVSRRHGPVYEGEGWQSYRPWLADEFDYRCAYCQSRLAWGHATGFELDHVEARTNGGAVNEYDNLVFACSWCNRKKKTQEIDDPFEAPFGSDVELVVEGEFYGTFAPIAGSVRGNDYLAKLGLREGGATNLRRAVVIVALAEARANGDPARMTDTERALVQLFFAWPAELYDLAKLRPIRNERPDGVSNSAFARRARKELEILY